MAADVGGASGGGPTEHSAPGSSDGIHGCDDLRTFIWECEQSGWQTFSCQEFLWKLHRCGGGLTLIYPTEDGYKCAGKTADVDPALVQKVVRSMCERLVRPAPGEDPCGPAVNDMAGGIIGALPGTCDPTIAFTEQGGCPVQPQVMVEVKQYCAPPSPYVPPVPCVTTGGPPFPPSPSIEAAMEGEGRAFIGAVGGQGTLSSRNAQLFADQGGGYAVEYLLYGLNVVKQ